MLLTGKNLGERQHQLNVKVNEEVNAKTNFNEIKQKPEKSDVDKLYKIDIAAKYENVEYILEIFKFGDSLYISRALDKCSWLCDGRYKDIINDSYLSTNVFPCMSIKMRNKLLTTVATHLKYDERIISFYKYCMKMKLHNIALKFLLQAPESFKLEVISTKGKAFTLLTDKEGEYMKNFIGNSFSLAEHYIKNLMFDGQKRFIIYNLRYLYSVSNDKYLDILETSGVVVNTLGRRLSKQIIKNNKARVMAKPSLYVNILNTAKLARKCTIDDAKIFAVALFPDRSTRFFHTNFYTKNKSILDLIPADERFMFIKKIFTEKYPGKEFETSHDFYSSGLYNVMTTQERETWALNNIEKQNEILGSGKDYLWYKFVNFDKAFVEMKKLIRVTTDANTRCDMLKVLVDSSNNQNELTKLLHYFHDRHMNEIASVKKSFLNKLIQNYHVWQFGEDCWKALEIIFYSLDIYENAGHQNNSDYMVLALMYYVINKKSIADFLNEFVDKHVTFRYLRNYDINFKDVAEIMFQYLLEFYVNKIQSLSAKPQDEDIKMEIRRYLRRVINLAEKYDKTKDELPEIVHTYIKLDWKEFKYTSLLADTEKFSSSDIMHYLKENADLVVSEFPKIKSYVESSYGNINWLFLKLRIYFSHDISQKYLIFFNKCLTSENLGLRTAYVSVCGILTLADDAKVIELVDKYAPEDKKIDYSKISSETIKIQQAICSQMYRSRPPLPLSKVLLYVVGDYVQYCLPLFRSYLLNLPHPQCLEFVESIMDKPISVQKHGVRLAFECFDEEKLKSVVLETWNKTKNVSLRMILYKSLFARILIEHDDIQLKLFEVLLTLTKDLNEDDDGSVFQVAVRQLPPHLVGRYLESTWNTLSKFPEKQKNLERLENILQHIECIHLATLSEDFLSKVIDDHVDKLLNKKLILNLKPVELDSGLYNLKWNLTARSLVYVANESNIEKKIEVIKNIIKQCVDMWDTHSLNNDQYIARRFMKSFIENVVSKSYNHDKNSYAKLITILQSIENNLRESLPEKDILMLIWNVRLNWVCKKVVLKSKYSLTASGDDEQISTDIRQSGILLGTAIGTLIKENVEEGKFFWMFSKQMNSVVSTMANNFYIFTKGPDNLNTNDVNVLFAVGLVEQKIPETFKFASLLLPTEYEGSTATFLNDYVDVLNKIQTFKNTELQYYVYEKFCNTDFKYRQYIK